MDDLYTIYIYPPASALAPFLVVIIGPEGEIVKAVPHTSRRDAEEHFAQVTGGLKLAVARKDPFASEADR
ncbi:MAG: hypothetical protein Q8M31_04030 [Beijerinckiaceae bacterium]|nr:hypothetical protein [Beijerinckiaceae bacterium]